jgi:hypothetical protein
MNNRAKPTTGTYVWWGGSVLIFFGAAIAFATAGQVLYAVLAAIVMVAVARFVHSLSQR